MRKIIKNEILTSNLVWKPTVVMARTISSTPLRRSSRNLKHGNQDIKNESPTKRIKTEPQTPKPMRIKTELLNSNDSKTKPSPSLKKTPKTEEEKATAEAKLQLKKLTSYTHNTSPFPSFLSPTPEECRLAHTILTRLHGDRIRPTPTTPITAPRDTAGCGNSPSVLDALIRTVLSQNTSGRNSSAAKRGMDAVYGRCDNWEAIISGGREKLEKAIQTGGLAAVKSKVIFTILKQVHTRHGEYSLDHLFSESSDEVCMREMLSFKGIGPKTASCVLLFCLRRESFAVDTHVFRLAGLLGWIPKGCGRDEAHAHLDARIPGEEKYALHILLIVHGKACGECKAGGKSLGICELRRAFSKGGEKVKEE